ncbi:UNVERIFIED_CONTAM: hypothetical protein HDU68_006473 [Siphonaria sp. JEL0065]|nr:hypothetical protein HDU68_006473 [Siphonaria sp. JEL0065]
MSEESPSGFVISASAEPTAPATPISKDTNESELPLTRIQFILVFTGLFLALLVVPLDTSIVAPGLQAIFMDLGHQSLLPWVGSAYTLAAAPVGIVFGKLAQEFGCKWMLILALVLFEAGSLMSAVSKSMIFLVVGRIVTGLGGGGMGAVINIVMSEICTVKERAKYQGILGMAYGLAYLLGPVVGGVLTDHISWRWCFYINIPIGVFAIIVCIAFLRNTSKAGTVSTIASRFIQIDFLGTIVLFAAMIAIDTPLQLGGNQWKWNSISSILCFIAFVILIVLFIHLEMNVIKNPLIPRRVFLNKTILAFSAISFALGAAMFAMLYYNALFFQIVFGDTAVESGVRTYPLVISFIVLSIASGAIFSRTDHYGSFFIFGPLVWSGGFILTAFLDANSSQAHRILAMIVLGVGVGSMLQLRVSAMQHTVDPDLMFVGTGLIASILYAGGTMAVSTTGAILDNIVASKTSSSNVISGVLKVLEAKGIQIDLSQYLAASAAFSRLSVEFPEQSQEFVAAKSELVGAFNSAFQVANLSLIGFVVVILVCVPFIWQTKRKEEK